MPKPLTALNILLVLAMLTSGTGCQVLGIPSYRHVGGPHSISMSTFEDDNVCGDDYCDAAECGLQCEPGIVPPLPGCLADWHAKTKLPNPPTHPRFHPLPTRPIFSPGKQPIEMGLATDVGNAHDPLASSRYGELPSPSRWAEPVSLPMSAAIVVNE